MRDIRECSGPWRGLWTQHAMRGSMGMTLAFRECRIIGGGSDRDGAFSIVGDYDPANEEVRLLKAYNGLRVWYMGTWNGQFVTGTSTIESWPLLDYGTFELWPESEETSLHMIFETDTSVATP